MLQVAAQVTARIRLGLLAAMALLAACERGPAPLKLVTPSLTLDLEIAQSLAALLEPGGEFRLTTTGSPQSDEHALDMLLAGEADLALISNYLPYRAGIATVMPLYPSVLHIAYREGWDASSGYTLLNQARVFAGPEGSPSRLILERIVDRLQLPQHVFSYVDRLAGDDDGDIDVLVVFAPITVPRRAELDGFRLFSFGLPADIGSGSIVDAATLLNPTLRPFVIPVGTYGDANPGPVLTVAVDKILVARRDLDSAVVYDLVNAIRRLRPALAASRAGLFDQFDDTFDVSKSTFVVHAGTQKFLQRAAPTIYERYSGVAEVAVTLLVTLMSAAVAGFRILQRRRKNRIDRFYIAIIAIRDSVNSNSSTAEREQARQKVRELQNTAFDQLVTEQLSADESFQIFITLSNDVLRQL